MILRHLPAKLDQSVCIRHTANGAFMITNVLSFCDDQLPDPESIRSFPSQARGRESFDRRVLASIIRYYRMKLREVQLTRWCKCQGLRL